MYKVKIYTWSGKTQFFLSLYNNEVGLYINKNDKRPKEELLDFLKQQIKIRELKVCMD